MQYSLWTNENRDRDMNSIIEDMLNFNEWHEAEIDEFDKSSLSFKISKRFYSNKSIEIGETIFEYNVLNYEFEKIRTRSKLDPIRATRIQTITGTIIIFSDNNVTKFIINKGLSNGTLTTLRKVTNTQKQREIVANTYTIDSDLFFWIVSKVIDDSDDEIGEAQNTKINSVNGFKGSTDDKLAEVEGSGDRILNLVSTLTFLLETDNLTRVGISLRHQMNTYGIKLGTSSFIDINENAYAGEYVTMQDDEMIPSIVLTVFLVVIPDLLSIYDQDIENGLWDIERKNEFLNSIGHTIQEKIQEKMGLLKK